MEFLFGEWRHAAHLLGAVVAAEEFFQRTGAAIVQPASFPRNASQCRWVEALIGVPGHAKADVVDALAAVTGAVMAVGAGGAVTGKQQLAPLD